MSVKVKSEDNKKRLFDAVDGESKFVVKRDNVVHFIGEVLSHTDRDSMLKLYLFNIQVRMTSSPFEKYAVSDFNNMHIRDYLLAPTGKKGDPKRTLFVAEVVENVMSGMEVHVNMENLSITETVVSSGFATGEVAPC